ncbi:MAG: gluconate 2-dehydrogenase subunit 3 family protein [Pseudomonadota bacterium]
MSEDSPFVNRRQAMVLLSGAGVALSFPSLAQALLSSANDERGVLFDARQMGLLAVLVEAVLPETDTPGGRALGVPRFVDLQLFACHSTEEQQRALALLDKFGERASKFSDAPPEEWPGSLRESVVSKLDLGMRPFGRSDGEAFRSLKRLMVFGYFTSERGATEVLRYQAVPGGFKGSIPYESVGTAWGSLAFY